TQKKKQVRATRVTASIERALASEPNCLNSRLLPEEKIASNLGLALRELRISLGKLTDKGYLVRKRSCGTFVLRLPEIDEDTREQKYESSESGQREISLDSLLARPVKENTSRGARLQRMPKDAQWLQLGLWTDLYDYGLSRPFHEINQAMLRRAHTLGHNLAIQSLTGEGGVPLSVGQLAESIERQPCDGYIAEAWTDRFTQAAG